MAVIYLLIAGVQVSLVHFYLVWSHKDNRRYSISEHAILDKSSHRLYIASHLVCDVFFLLYSYYFFVSEQNLSYLLSFAVVFAVLDAFQAIVPSGGRTEKLHFVIAYISWVSFIALGVAAFFLLSLSTATQVIAGTILLPILGLFIYMHINRTKLYPYQLALVPLYVLYMSILTIYVN